MFIVSYVIYTFFESVTFYVCGSLSMYGSFFHRPAHYSFCRDEKQIIA